MKITILTALFPPDTGAPAPYVKLLTKKLAKDNEVTTILHGYLPESVPRATLLTINKRRNKLFRFIATLTTLFHHSKKDTSLIIVNNGVSVELPTLLYSLFSRAPVVLCISDPIAKQASEQGFYRKIHQQLTKRAVATVTLPDEIMYLPLEKLPFTKPDSHTTQTQNEWWHTHLQTLVSYGKQP